VFMCLMQQARAQDSPFMMNPGAFSNQIAIKPMMDRLERSHQSIFGQSTEASLNRTRTLYRGPAAAPDGEQQKLKSGDSTQFSPSMGSDLVKKLALHYPEASRTETERLFRQLLSGYGQIERQFGVPKHDVAGSVAAFLAGSYMAYRNVDFPDEHFKPLVAQMRQIIGSNPDFAKASNAEKQEMYEQMAILGMFMANTQMALKEKPNAQIAANMRQAAKGYLEQFLKTDADRVQITAQGLVLK
jgi:hypothetical protein